MKQRSHPTDKKRGNSPYHKYGKKEFDYTPMYRRILAHEPTSGFAKHLREHRKMQA